MIIDVDEAPVIALATLKEKQYTWQAPANPIWPSTWPVFNRLIERHEEMEAVYREIATSGITRQQFWLLLEQIVHTGSFGTEQNHAMLRADYEELTKLNDDIS